MSNPTDPMLEIGRIRVPTCVPSVTHGTFRTVAAHPVDPMHAVRCALDLLYAGRVDEATAKLLPVIGWTGTVDAWKEHQRGIRA
jgi:hypothetical protein